MITMKKNVIIGISGVTNGGKTTLAQNLKNALPNCKIVNQDFYFLPISSPQHTQIPALNHINWDILSSLDMNKMLEDVNLLLGINQSEPNIADQYNISKRNAPKIVIIEGFCLFECEAIEKLCDLKYFITLTKEECLKRRNGRKYDPPDCVGYFEQCVWPEYLKHLEFVQYSEKNVNFLDGKDNSFDSVLKEIQSYMKNHGIDS